MKGPSNRNGSDRLVDRLRPGPERGALLGFAATTFELDSGFFETDYLPSILGIGAWDDRSWSSRIALEHALQRLDAAALCLDPAGYRTRPRSLRIDVHPWTGSAVLHAKVSLLLHEAAIVILVGSANLTEPGYRRNREAMVEIAVTEKDIGSAALVEPALRGLAETFPSESPAARLIGAAQAKLRRWVGMDAAPISDQWLWSDGAAPLLDRFAALWPQGEALRSLTVVSPFWSERIEPGPIGRLVAAFRSRAGLDAAAQLRLATVGRQEKGESVLRPVLPEAYGSFDMRTLGFAKASAAVVDPQERIEGVGTSLRNLHAKLVLVEGRETSLLYLGSANFTAKGWGTVAQANREAGVALLRQGASRTQLRSLIPRSVGDSVPLHGAASAVIHSQPIEGEAEPWPRFILDLVVHPTSGGGDQLELAVTVQPGLIQSAWLIALGERTAEPKPADVLWRSSAEAHSDTIRVALDAAALDRLIVAQQVLIVWDNGHSCRHVPVNVAVEAKPRLPVAPGAGAPSEVQIFAYYQGRIRWDELFPPSPSLSGDDDVPAEAPQHFDDLDRVDVSGILAYRVRAFVEALPGMLPTLTEATVTDGALRLALTGPASPVALARIACDGVLGSKPDRSITAAAFQVVEILAILLEARAQPVSQDRVGFCAALFDAAIANVESCLERLRAASPESFASGSPLDRYAQRLRAVDPVKVPA